MEGVPRACQMAQPCAMWVTVVQLRLSLHPGLSGTSLSAVGKALRLLGTQTQASWGLEVWQGVT